MRSFEVRQELRQTDALLPTSDAAPARARTRRRQGRAPQVVGLVDGHDVGAGCLGHRLFERGRKREEDWPLVGALTAGGAATPRGTSISTTSSGEQLQQRPTTLPPPAASRQRAHGPAAPARSRLPQAAPRPRSRRKRRAGRRRRPTLWAVGGGGGGLEAVGWGGEAAGHGELWPAGKHTVCIRRDQTLQPLLQCPALHAPALPPSAPAPTLPHPAPARTRQQAHGVLAGGGLQVVPHDALAPLLQPAHKGLEGGAQRGVERDIRPQTLILWRGRRGGGRVQLSGKCWAGQPGRTCAVHLGAAPQPTKLAPQLPQPRTAPCPQAPPHHLRRAAAAPAPPRCQRRA